MDGWKWEGGILDATTQRVGEFLQMWEQGRDRRFPISDKLLPKVIHSVPLPSLLCSCWVGGGAHFEHPLRNGKKTDPVKTICLSIRRLRAGRLLESTQFWCGFKITQVKDNSGWEVTCYLPEHRTATGKHCRRTLSFVAHGGVDLAERKLK